MYLSHYKFREQPFAISCDPKFFFESSVHAEALANMVYTAQEHKGMVLVSGEVGAGKTFVVNMLGPRLGAAAMTVIMRNPPQSPKQLLRSLAVGVGLNVKASIDKQTLLEDLEQQLVRLHARGRMVVLVLDESQDLPAGALEELRLLWNWELDGKRLTQIVLVGQPELRERLMEPKWEPLRQRIVLAYHLGPLTRDDTPNYVRHRIGIAADEGCTAAFAPEALAEIHAATDGIPRLINILCDNALLVGYARGVHLIDLDIVRQVIREMTCWGLKTPPLAPPQPVMRVEPPPSPSAESLGTLAPAAGAA